MALDSEKFVAELTLDLKDMESKIKEGRVKIDGLKKEAEEKLKLRLSVAIATLQSELDKARKELSKFKKEGDEKGELEARLKIQDLQAKVKTAKGSLKELETQGKATSKSFFSLSTIVKDAIAVFASFQVVRKLASALKDAFTASVEFESAFAGVKKVIDATDSEFAVLEQQFRDLAKEIPVAVTELAKIGELGGQLGVAKEDLLEFTKTISQIATATNLTEEEAATSFARIANIFQLPVTEVENLASTVVDLGNKFAATESEILDFATRISGAGKIAGLTTAEVAAIGAAFSSVGVEAEAGGTAVQKTLITLNTVVAQGGAELERFAQVSGVTAADFASLWQSDPAQAFNLFTKGLKASGDDAASILDELVAGDQRLTRAFLSVAEAGDLLTNALGTANTAFSENTALSAEAEKRYETTASRIQALKNRVNDLAISLGTVLKETILPIAEALVNFIEALAGAENRMSFLASTAKTLAAALTAALGVAVLGKIGSGLGSLSKSVKRVGVDFELMKLQAKLAGKELGLVATFTKGILTPFGAFTLALSLAAAGVAALIEHNKNLRRSFEDLDVALDELGADNSNLRAITAEFEKQIGLIKEMRAEAGGLNSDLTREQINVEFDLATEQFELMAAASGLSAERVAELTAEFAAFKFEVRDTVAQNEFVTKATEEMGEAFSDVSDKFNTVADAVLKSTSKIEDVDARIAAIAHGIEVAANESVESLGLIGEAAEKTTEDVIDQFLSKKAEMGDVGEAFSTAFALRMSSAEARSRITIAGETISNAVLTELISNAYKVGDVGELDGLLFAAGIQDKGTREGILAAENVGDAIIAEFEKRAESALGSGRLVGSSLAGGIAQGLYDKYPSIKKAAQAIATLLNGLGAKVDFSTFEKAVDSVAGEGFFSSFNEQVITPIENSIREALDLSTNIVDAIETADAVAGGLGGSGGGGAGADALKEAEKAAEESERAIEAYGKEVDAVNKAQEQLRDDTKAFYDDIVDSIKSAEEAQASLRAEFDKFKTTEEVKFAEDAGQRDFELAQDEADVRAEIADGLAEEEVDQDKINELNDELNRILEERAQIQEYLNGLNEEQRAAFDEANRREGLTEFEQSQLDLQDTIAAKEEEVNLEIEKQQRIIDIQKKFLEVQNSQDQAVIDARQKLYDIASGKMIATEEERLALLEELGFTEEELAGEQLTRLEELELLKQFQQAESLRLEAEAVAQQQQDLLDIKQEYIDLAEQAHNESADRMIAKTMEVIAAIEAAIAAQRELSGLSEAAATAAGGTTVNNEFNVTNSVDAQIVADTITSKL